TSSPTAKLDVVGTVNATNFYDRDNSQYYLDPSEISYFKNLVSKGNIYIESFEGDFPPYNFTTGGDNNWVKNITIFYEGSASSSSGTINHNQKSWIDVDIYYSSDGYLSFYWKVSSEPQYDYLVFCIDNDNACSSSGGYIDRISGNVGWTKKIYNVSKGIHSFRWLYEKDDSVSIGDDKGYIDRIEFIDGGYVFANYINTTDLYLTNLFSREKIFLGTLTSNSKFHVQWSSTNCGTQCFSNAAIFENNGNVFIQLMGSVSGEKSINFANPLNGADGAIKYNYQSVPNGFSFWTNGNNFRMAIDQDGNVGINTTSPKAKIHINSTGSTLIIGNSSSLHFFVNSTSGNIGIGTNKPMIDLEVSGGVMLNTTKVKPFCNENIRGTLWFEKSQTENDKLYLCMRNSTGNYNWILIAIGGFGT
ncbi:MAG: hypothetical protein KQA31_00115, partial [Candidatus Aenigmarchaeota archaeon]|nr:hypothetical protein [Candidatus Aenigmarchaeota archaeon]